MRLQLLQRQRLVLLQQQLSLLRHLLRCQQESFICQRMQQLLRCALA
jgi:hypothetical protein